VQATGVTFFTGTVGGTFDGQPMSARMRYTRTWVHDDDAGWRILAAHIAVQPPT
jgi:ketosteroid isomerase-like protein